MKKDNCKKNNHKKSSPLNSLFEVENFLCNFRNLKKSVSLLKLLKK